MDADFEEVVYSSFFGSFDGGIIMQGKHFINLPQWASISDIRSILVKQGKYDYKRTHETTISQTF